MYCFYNAIEVHLAVAPATKLDVIGNNLQNVATIGFLADIFVFYPLFTPKQNFSAIVI